jgi:DNA repair exonuclease SbcCD nuclease subunit
MKFDVLGDPHLGRSFVHGVPLHRRGDREATVWADFNRSLMNTSADLHICMGDLFDKAYVSYDIIVSAALAYQAAAAAHPKTTFVILRGNHDIKRDLEAISAFDLFNFLMAHTPNVRVLTEGFTQIGDCGFYPWHPTTPAGEFVQPSKYAFGHWDTQSFGGDDHNLVPLKELMEAGVEHVYTGHVHKKEAGDYLTVVGSMQPYAHGEESDDKLYVTKSLAEVQKDPEAFKNKCLRVVLEPGELFDIDVDCLQLTVKRKDGPDAIEEEVVLGDFDIKSLFAKAFEEAGVPEAVQELIIERFDEQSSRSS